MKNILITGATSGIGFAALKKFDSNNSFVLAVGRNQEKLNEIKNQFNDRVEILNFDLADSSARKKLFVELNRKKIELDVVVNAAGILRSGSIEDTSLDSWNEMMEINLNSVFHIMNLSIPFLEKRKGNIVNVSSVTGLRSFPNVLAYCVSKAALDQLTRCAALELAPKGIRVNAVNPGVVVTNIHKASGMDESAYQAFLERSKATHPIGRVGISDEIADLIFYLSSSEASWITGNTVSIDGGRNLTCAR
ncbi:MAG: SDR family oxidoreductase [Ignavibacteria bacterium]|nr:SDR family oxidoreductase [Ignavibacteria bacterium]